MTKEERNAKRKIYRKANKEKIAAQMKVYYEANKEKRATYKKAYKKTIDGLISKIYGQQKQSSKKRGHQPPTYSKELLHRWITAHVIFQELYDNWIASNYEKDLVPSVDRLDDSKGYSFDNIQLMTWKENNAKYKNRNKNKK